MRRTRELVPYLLVAALAAAAGLAVATAGKAADPKVVKIADPATYNSKCGDAYNAVRYYRTAYNKHRAVLGYSPAPKLEQAMTCERTRERAAYWTDAAKINRQAVEKRYTIPVSNDWRTSVLIIQRAFPGTQHVLLSCSSAEGGHGNWVIYGGGPYYPGAEHAQTFHGHMVGGPMQYMWPTFKGHYRHGLDSLRERGFRVKLPAVHDVAAWRSMTAQAIAAGWAFWSGNDNSHWSASSGSC